MQYHVDTETVWADFERIALLSRNGFKEGWNHNNHYHRLLLKHVPASCTYALDIGCGTGEFARLLARRAEHVLALDFSPQTLQLARERSTHVPNIEFVAADAMTWEFLPAQFDYIVSIAAAWQKPW